MALESLFPQSAGVPFETDPALIPNVLTAVTAHDSWVDLITLTNETAADATVTIQDTTNSRGFLTSVTVKANTTEVIRLAGGRKFPGGVKWSCGTLNAVTGYMRGVKRKS